MGETTPSDRRLSFQPVAVPSLVSWHTASCRRGLSSRPDSRRPALITRPRGYADAGIHSRSQRRAVVFDRMTSDPSRRDFLRTSALAGAAAAIGVDSGHASSPTLEPETPLTSEPARPSWVDRPMRWAQLTL